MNPEQKEPMKIICTDGKGREKNPYEPELFMPIFGGGHKTCPNFEYTLFESEHPSLLTFTPDGKPFMENGEFDGELVWQYYDVVRDCWDCHKDAKDFKGCDTRQIYMVKLYKYSRETPYNVSISGLLEELLEYMEDRSDVVDSDSEMGVSPNTEMRFATDIAQALFQLERDKHKTLGGKA